MTYLELHTNIRTSVQKAFDLARNIDFHIKSAIETEEEAVAGTTSGCIGLGETVTWRGRHVGFFLTHRSKITQMKSPRYFVDEMTKGCFTIFRHYHLFKAEKGCTRMTDILIYKVPYGILGDLFNFFFLKAYLRKFLILRNLRLKNALES